MFNIIGFSVKLQPIFESKKQNKHTNAIVCIKMNSGYIKEVESEANIKFSYVRVCVYVC